MIAFGPAPSISLTFEPVPPQLDQFVTSHVRVTGHEPSADQINDFIARHGLTNSSDFRPCLADEGSGTAVSPLPTFSRTEE